MNRTSAMPAAPAERDCPDFSTAWLLVTSGLPEENWSEVVPPPGIVSPPGFTGAFIRSSTGDVVRVPGFDRFWTMDPAGPNADDGWIIKPHPEATRQQQPAGQKKTPSQGINNNNNNNNKAQPQGTTSSEQAQQESASHRGRRGRVVILIDNVVQNLDDQVKLLNEKVAALTGQVLSLEEQVERCQKVKWGRN